MLPNLVIIGAMKCGTSSLHYYLSLHPEVFMSTPKELDFFVAERHWPKGRAWYESHFPDSPAKIRGESSTFYTRCHVHSGVAERMHGMIPHARLIYMVRDPVERLRSQYEQRVLMGREKQPIREAVLGSTRDLYLDDSRYYRQLEEYLKFFKLEDILIFSLEEMKADQSEILERVFRFLGVEESFTCEEYCKIKNRSVNKRPRNALGRAISMKPIKSAIQTIVPASVRRTLSPLAAAKLPPGLEAELSDDMHAELCELLKPDAERLRALTGQRFETWPV